MKLEEGVSNSKSTALIYFIVSGFCTLSLSVVKIFNGYSVTIASFFILYYIYKIRNKLKNIELILIIFFPTFFIINAFIHVVELNYIEFLKSFLLTIVFIFVFISSLDTSKFFVNDKIIYSIIKYSSFLIIFFELIQISEQILLGTTLTWFVLDGISISTADDIGRFEAVNLLGFFRPTSFFHEPSYMAMVLFILLLILNKKFNHQNLLNIILILAIILSMSSLMILIMLMYLTVRYLYKSKLILSIILISLPLFLLFGFGNYFSEFFRLNEIANEGTSGYVRVIEPLLVTKNYILSNPLGIPLGQSDVVFNNSIFLFPLYFGILTPFVIAIILINIFKNINKRIDFFNYLLGIGCLLIVNGAIFTIESAFLILFLNLTYFNKK
jgi:hypothetical protein